MSEGDGTISCVVFLRVQALMEKPVSPALSLSMEKDMRDMGS